MRQRGQGQREGGRRRDGGHGCSVVDQQLHFPAGEVEDHHLTPDVPVGGDEKIGVWYLHIISINRINIFVAVDNTLPL